MYLQITYDKVYYLVYSKLKSFIEHKVLAPKLVYQILNSFGYVNIYQEAASLI